ncbi:MarR family winged helix-turn-helix transcriptional regulator [Haloimpatiens sp. FM7330]|uniref:MarR family winged helix-turn-helix transcriptional regulator n=1 Tax=Haloimpatiens sp. FM7330 TaxID=3298610 RepID=UPI0036333B8F
MKTRDISNKFVQFLMKLKKYARATCNDKSHKSNSNITMQQFRTMMGLRELKKCSLKDLSKKTRVSTSSLCIMLNKLSDGGYIEREIDNKDRRNTFYSLTEHGMTCLDKELKNKLKQLDEIIDKLSPEKKQKFFESIVNLEEILEELNQHCK